MEILPVLWFQFPPNHRVTPFYWQRFWKTLPRSISRSHFLTLPFPSSPPQFREQRSHGQGGQKIRQLNPPNLKDNDCNNARDQSRGCPYRIQRRLVQVAIDIELDA